MPCTYCKRELRPGNATDVLARTRDHVVPVSRGGSETVPCCYQCNSIKSDMMPAEWSAFMQANPRWWETRPVKPPNPYTCPVLAVVANELMRARYGIWRVRE